MRTNLTDQRLDGPLPKAIFVDADDTLWENNHFFLMSLDWLCRTCRQFGWTDTAVKTALNRWEHRNIPRLGFSYGSYETSLLAALKELVLTAPYPQPWRHPGLRQEALRWTHFLRRHPILFMPGVEETLPLLASRVPVFIVTKGDQHDQMAKVHRSGLLSVVKAAEVIPTKRPAEYTTLLEKYGLAPDDVVMIGNSPHSDVNNAKRAGIRTVFVPHPRTWEFEMEPILNEQPATVTAPHFAAVPGVLGLH